MAQGDSKCIFLKTTRVLVPMSSASDTVERAAQQLTEWLVRTLNDAVSPQSQHVIRRELLRARTRMQDLGGNPDKMSLITVRVPNGTLVRGPVVIFDRKQAYQDEFRNMRDECPAVAEAFSDLKAWFQRRVNPSDALYAVAARFLTAPHLTPQQVKTFTKKLYTYSYGKFYLHPNTKLLAELACRRNAVLMRELANHYGSRCVAVYTDSLMLRGLKDPDKELAQINARGKATFQQEFRGNLALIGTTNLHLLVSSGDDDDFSYVVRPHGAFRRELVPHFGEERVRELLCAIVRAGRAQDRERLAKCWHTLTRKTKLTLQSRAGKQREAEPSVLRLLKYFSGNSAGGAPVSSEPRLFYSTMAAAERAQQAASEPLLLVALALRRKRGGGEYRKFRLVSPSEQHTLVGYPYHHVFAGFADKALGVRAFLDWDEPTPLPPAALEEKANALRRFWRQKKNLTVTVETLRSHTHRQGEKAHAEHVVFVVTDTVTGKECVLRNVVDVPEALALRPAFNSSSSVSSPSTACRFDCHPYNHHQSFRMMGGTLPTESEHQKGDPVGAHVPLDQDINWSPDRDEYAKYSVVTLTHDAITYCSTPPPSPQRRLCEDARALLPSQQTVVKGVNLTLEQWCGDNYKLSGRGGRWYANHAHGKYRLFLITVLATKRVGFERHADPAQRLLNFDQWMRKVMKPALQGDPKVPKVLHAKGDHRKNNHSYFLLRLPEFPNGALELVARTHAESAQTYGAGSPQAVKKRRGSSYGETLTFTPAAVKRLLLPFNLFGKYQAQVRQEHTVVVEDLPMFGGDTFDPKSPAQVWCALLHRYSFLQTYRQSDEDIVAGLRDHQSACLCVSFLARHAKRDVALRAVCAEIQVYETMCRRKPSDATCAGTLAMLREQLDFVRGGAVSELQGDPRVWAAVLRFAAAFTYKDDVM